MNNAFFEKTIENVKNRRDIIKLITTETRRNYQVSETNYQTARFF